jgi:hypothetical protein
LSNRVTPINEHRRLELSREVYALAVQRLSHTEIGKHLGIDRRTVAKYYAEELARRKEDREPTAEREKAISTYEYVIRKNVQMIEAFTKGRRIPYLNGAKANALVGATNSIIAAQRAIDDITGVQAPKKKAIAVEDTSQRIPLDQLSPGLVDALAAELLGDDGDERNGIEDAEVVDDVGPDTTERELRPGD